MSNEDRGSGEGLKRTNVANLYSLKSGWEKDVRFVYIGRKGRGHDGYFGNPFPLQPGEPRGATIERVRAYAEKRIEPSLRTRCEPATR